MTHESLPRLPQTSESLTLFSSEHVQALRESQEQYGSPRRFISALMERYTSYDIRDQVLIPFSALVQPTEITADPATKYAGAAFYKGSVVGAYASELVGGNHLLAQLSSFNQELGLDDQSVRDRSDIRSALSEFIAQIGMEGYYLADNFHSLIENLETHVVRPNYYECFRWGFGAIMNMAHDVSFSREQAALRACVTPRTDAEWDNELTTLLQRYQPESD